MDQVSGSRACAHPQCQTRLSRYNPDVHCAVHGGWADDESGRRNRNAV